MYEEMTYETILEDMLSRVSNEIDKREGSLIYDAIAPCAYHLAQAYFIFTNYSDLYLVDTAVGVHLDRIGMASSVVRNPAIQAIVKAEATKEIEIGTRYGRDGVTYTATKKLGADTYQLECDQTGECGNYLGVLENIDNTGVTVTIVELIRPGEEEEEEEHFRQRILDKIRLPITSGNRYQYQMWATEVKGVGAAKVFPLAAGPGTVKIVITNEDKGSASAELIKNTAEHLEELRPIGAEVTVISAVEKKIDLNARVKLTNGADRNVVEENVKLLLTDYLKGCAFEASYISVAKIGNILWDVEGIEDYTELTLNHQPGNAALAEEEVAVTGSIQLEVEADGNEQQANPG